MSATAGRRSCPKQPRCLPKGSFHSHDRLSREIVGSNYERVVVKRLSPGWLVIGVAETHQRVPEERSKLSASFFQLCAGSGRLQNLCNIGPHLQLCMPIVVSSRRKLRSLPASKDRLRHLEFRKLLGEWNELIVSRASRRSLLYPLESVVKGH